MLSSTKSLLKVIRVALKQVESTPYPAPRSGAGRGIEGRRLLPSEPRPAAAIPPRTGDGRAGARQR